MTDKNVTVIESTPANLLGIAVQQNADIEKIEKLMDLQIRWEKNEAKKAYVVAMTEFKKNPPEILKQTVVSYTVGTRETTYNHASLDHVAEKINVALSKHGLFASWPQSQSESGITVTCKITHEGGHSEETSLTAAADLSGSKNAIQGLGSTITYLQRYTILALTGLAAKGMDNDGNVPGEEPEPIRESQIEDIFKLQAEKKITSDDFAKRVQRKYGVDNIDRLDCEQADELIGILKDIK